MAAYDEEERRRKNYGKELPPITLSNTSVPGLVTLIPILVSLTSQGQSPRFDDEKDKPVWWPADIRWQNPKSYSTYMGENILKLLRKVVRSCYSYHGVEDLLCRLDEAPLSYTVEDEDNLDSVNLSDSNFIGDDGPDSCSSSDNLVFVCCFCLEEFSSHEEVTCHQNMCHLRFQVQSADSDLKPSFDKDSRASPLKTLVNTSSKPSSPPYPVSLHKSNGLATSSHIPATTSQVRSSDRASNHVPNSTEKVSSYPKQRSSTNSTRSANHVTTSSAAKKQTSFYPFVPTLKTRSQKKLDQIMEKHNSRKLMLNECRRIKGLADKGAWWTQRRRRKSFAPTPHPSTIEAKESFLSSCGLTLRVSAEAQIKGLKPAVDLDCEIILVEGPLSNQPTKQEATPSLSPRGSRSLMSQLSRDTDLGSRRRLSFCFVEDEWADKEALEEGRDPLQMSLLTIDLSSPLGQRIKKYAKADGALSIIKDPELYCKTEIEDDSYSRLRFRAMDYKVTYRRKCRGSTYVHLYKFNRSNVEEFKARLKTGLSARSRRLRQSMKSCRVSLKRLMQKEIKSWTEEKKVSIAENIVYDDDLCITQIEIPESKVKGYLMPNVKKSSSHAAQPPSCQNLQPRPQQKLHHEHQDFQRCESSSSWKNFTPSSSHPQKPASGLSPSLYLNHSSSPPHVPNIFRNRNFHSASPQSQAPGKAHNAHQNTQFRLMPLSGGPGRQKTLSHRQAPSATRPQASCNDGFSSTPSFSPSLIITEQRPLTSNANNSGRRKQAMTQVRQDEQEEKSLNRGSSSTHAKSGAFVNLSTFSSSESKNHHLQSYASSSSSSSSSNSFSRKNNTQNARHEPPRLSNFEYLSIKKGLLTSGHSLPENNLKKKDSSCPKSSHSGTSVSSRGHPSSAIPSPRKQPCMSISPSNNKDHASATLGPSNSVRAPFSQTQRVVNDQKSPNSHLWQPKMKPSSFAADDDIMEVICIDD